MPVNICTENIQILSDFSLSSVKICCCSQFYILVYWMSCVLGWWSDKKRNIDDIISGSVNFQWALFFFLTEKFLWIAFELLYYMNSWAKSLCGSVRLNLLPIFVFSLFPSSPESVRHRADLFYLHPDHSCVPNSPLWFSSNPLDDRTVEAMLVRILAVREVQRENSIGVDR